MAQRHPVPWQEADRALAGLPTDVEHEVVVQREAIPILFVPGVMGSRLRRPGTDGQGEAGGLPNLRWDPSAGFLYDNFSGSTPAQRKRMLIGERFDPSFLEPDNANPVADGFRGLMADYRGFLTQLRTRDWGALGKIFVFPVYGFGYNWTDSNQNSGRKLATRIDEVIAEARATVGLCEKVILITHSMGGLVARAACGLSGAAGKVLGVIHGVQPAFGAPAAYWRMKAGFEGDWIAGRIASRFLGHNGRDVTALLANCPGGLQLLPSKRYRTNGGGAGWLQITGLAGGTRTLPRHGDPYREIYRVPAVVNGPEVCSPEPPAFWGLVDPSLLRPEDVPAAGGNELDALAESMQRADAAWQNYLGYLALAESFHDQTDGYIHPNTWRFHGSQRTTAETVTLAVESNRVRSENYPVRGFRGFFWGDESAMQAILQNPAGGGDGTVPVSSATFQGSHHRAPGQPDNQEFRGLEHQPAYEGAEPRRWVVCAITALCEKHFTDKHG